MAPKKDDGSVEYSQSELLAMAETAGIAGDQLDEFRKSLESTEAAGRKFNKTTREGNSLLDNYAGYGLSAVTALSALDGEAGAMARTFLETTKKIAEESYKNLQTTNDAIEGLLAPYTALNEAIGGVTKEMIIGNIPMNEFARTAFETQQEFSKALAGMGESSIQFQSESGALKNVFTSLFPDKEGLRDAQRRLDGITEYITDNNVMLSKELSQQERVRMVALGKALDISSTKMTELATKQFAFTGEASTELFENIASTAVALESKTGLPLQALKKDIIAIKSETELFGDIGVDAAGRIAASLQMLGVEFSSFKAMTNQFMNFDSAAGKMGELSALFGIQMDAMEMTYLANEDQEEFMYRMRESILESGIDVENMSKTRLRALKSQLGLGSVEEVKTFLQTGAFDEFGEESLQATTDSAAGIDGMDAAMKRFASTGQDAARTFEDEVNVKITAASADMVTELTKVQTKAGDIQNAFADITLGPEQIATFKQAAAGYERYIQGPQAALAKITGAAGEGLIKNANQASSVLLGTAEDIDNLITGKKVESAVSVINQYDTGALTTSIVDSQAPFMDALVSNTTTNQQLVTQLSGINSTFNPSNFQSNININMDGQTVAQGVLNNIVNKNLTTTNGQSLVVTP